MKINNISLLICAMLTGICVIGLSCGVRVDAPQEATSSDVVALGGSDGYVLLLHPNGNFYSVELKSGAANVVASLPALSKSAK